MTELFISPTPILFSPQTPMVRMTVLVILTISTLSKIFCNFDFIYLFASL